ncbi:MAG: Crp/Fnr family transcriptional regulator [Alphaproteobacteria bacterium]|nr:Crp/Fnr family transcriptional regulator [Alphaproteobacteria bacterium]
MSLPDAWTNDVPALSPLDDATRKRLLALARPLAAPAGTRLFGEGSPCQAYLILLSGTVRVQKVGENGREIVLYRVEAGETCVVTTACLMSGTDYDAEGIAETAIEAQALPMAAFRELLAASAPFRDFVFKAYATRISSLLMLIEEVAFGRIDQRLAACLIGRSQGKAEINATHQELAVELGTAREVVSRQLKEFERQGWLRLGRGQIILLATDALESRAASKTTAV